MSENIALSRLATKPLQIPDTVSVALQPGVIVIKGPKGEGVHHLSPFIQLKQEGKTIFVLGRKIGRADITPAIRRLIANLSAVKQHQCIKQLSGTTWSILRNILIGVSTGFEKTLLLEGVGYKAAIQGNKLQLVLGYSHPIQYVIPSQVTIETPTPTMIKIKGIDKREVGQIAADIRRFRAVEPYKGKGIRYSDETVSLKETKKK